MLSHAEFTRFRGFERLKVDLIPHAYIVGPNSAGKSTVLEAVGLAERCLRIARRKSPTLGIMNNGRTWRGFPLPASIDNEDDPVRFDFGRDETRVTVKWLNGSRIHLVWPKLDRDDESRSYFYLEDEDGAQPRTPNATRALFSQVTVLPVVTPLDRMEELKNPEYVQLHLGSRLASRHFRNHAYQMSKSSEWSQFKDFCGSWLPEIALLDVELDTYANRLAVFYMETGSRVPKELAWAGDGIQIWVQLLWHIFRASDASTIVLDEPEVYLHPDLQRRLVRLLGSLSAQIILASHSADVIAEAPPDGVLWVDRRGVGARRARSQQTLSALSASLGSSYNLALARSMRARLVVASDCEDPRVIRALAKTIGATNLADEYGVSLVQLRDASRWAGSGQLGKALREVLQPNTPAAVLLQSGYRTERAREDLIQHLRAPGIDVRIWSRVELESYLIDADTIARVSGAAPEIVTLKIIDSCSRLREATRAAFVSSRVRFADEGHGRLALEVAEREFDLVWSVPGRQLELVRGSEVISDLNLWLVGEGYRAVSGYTLAKSIRPQALVPELIAHLVKIDESGNAS